MIYYYLFVVARVDDMTDYGNDNALSARRYSVDHEVARRRLGEMPRLKAKEILGMSLANLKDRGVTPGTLVAMKMSWPTLNRVFGAH